ncbi:MAG: hypothetical protein IJ856_02965 [Candidatus Methanomethylophilaceae archaeon]|nr:hypothetical protein [Candidatus Methanomethylophilaceae archaeon]
MGLFDNIKSAASGGQSSKDVVFSRLPNTLEEFKALPQASLTDPFDTAALTVLALCFYPQDKDLSLQMVDYLKGPKPLSAYDKQFIADRFVDQDYIPRSYFKGTSPANDYTPSEPYTVTVKAGPYAYQDDGYAKLDLVSSGADSPRQIQLRKAKDGKWYLWEQFVLVGIRKAEGENPWA